MFRCTTCEAYRAPWELRKATPAQVPRATWCICSESPILRGSCGSSLGNWALRRYQQPPKAMQLKPQLIPSLKCTCTYKIFPCCKTRLHANMRIVDCPQPTGRTIFLHWNLLWANGLMINGRFRICSKRTGTSFHEHPLRTSSRSASLGKLQGSEIPLSAHSPLFEMTERTWNISSFAAMGSFQPRLQW